MLASKQGFADEVLAADGSQRLTEIGTGDPTHESLGAVWRSRLVGWGADASRRARGRELLAAAAVRALQVEAGRFVADVGTESTGCRWWSGRRHAGRRSRCVSCC